MVRNIKRNIVKAWARENGLNFHSEWRTRNIRIAPERDCSIFVDNSESSEREKDKKDGFWKSFTGLFRRYKAVAQ